ncbi:hypothetical protein ASG52_12870 [Methylobacterium sp. Leaf456]|uniref:hypothetical protein n=1 Tax=Methylobacterium sp. Leaf456 TaxID=1736382 RepID=UPI0006FADB26|nr:hypothetical protein [Methylobacterium sp. Leaf456]KQT46606.1 hypothetical protein ASG52_12870 [Methylobacterium sp. Leaf456]
MPLKSGALTRQETQFVHAMTRINNPTEAARLAGYTQPSSRGGDLMRRPEVVARVQAEVQHILRTRGAEVGVRVLIEIAEGEKFTGPARAMAARELVKLSGVGSKTDDDSRPLHMLSAAELHAKALKAQAWLDELERNTIEHEPAPSPTEGGGFFD